MNENTHEWVIRVIYRATNPGRVCIGKRVRVEYKVEKVIETNHDLREERK